MVGQGDNEGKDQLDQASLARGYVRVRNLGLINGYNRLLYAERDTAFLSFTAESWDSDELRRSLGKQVQYDLRDPP